MMYSLSLLVLTITPLLPATLALVSVLRSLDAAPVLHFTLARRGGVFAFNDNTVNSIDDPRHELANLTLLAEELGRVEARFNQTKREVKGNKLIRKAKDTGAGGSDGRTLMGEIGANGVWFARVAVGEPPQEIEMDLNMLVSDFSIVTTSSRKGSRYDDFFSQSNVKTHDHPYPTCGLPIDMFYLPTINVSKPLSFAHCRPSHSSLNTLLPSGSILGLAPSTQLSQTKTPSFVAQLLEKHVIERPLFSIMLINGEEGVLSVGGTSAGAVDMVEKHTRDTLDRAGVLEKGEPEIGTLKILKRSSRMNKAVSVRQTDWEDSWKWSRVQGAEGWWQTLMDGVWVDGSKVLKNQPVVIDINTPFILAPPVAAKTFYASISGSRQLPHPHSNFYSYPCLNPPVSHFEFGGWTFPALQGGKGASYFGMPGGKFSLGRVRDGSGYCVGAVVETRMGVAEEGHGSVAGNGMRGTWVVGETFFRGVGGAFDFKKQRIGFRTY